MSLPPQEKGPAAAHDKQYLCEYKCEECGLKFPKIDLKEHSLKHKETGVKAQREENKIINCEDCEYSAQSFNDFGISIEKHLESVESFMICGNRKFFSGKVFHQKFLD